jgi:hypothetical protein
MFVYSEKMDETEIMRRWDFTMLSELVYVKYVYIFVNIYFFEIIT